MAQFREEGLPPTEGFIPGGMGVEGPADLRAFAASITGSKGHQMGKPMSIMHKDPKSMMTSMPNVTIDSENDEGDPAAPGGDEENLPSWKTGGV